MAKRTPKPKTVTEAVEKDLSAMPANLSESGLALSAVELARQLDSDSSATSKSMCARALHAALDRLRELAPPAREADAVDEITARRERRLGR
jgi:hypothetical protein